MTAVRSAAERSCRQLGHHSDERQPRRLLEAKALVLGVTPPAGVSPAAVPP